MVRVSPEDTEEELRDLDDDEAMTHRALEILGSHRNDAYQAARAELRDDTRGWWADVLAGDVAVLDDGREEIGRRPLLRDRAFGESLDPDKLSGSAATRCTWTADFSGHGGLSRVGLPDSNAPSR